MSITLHHYHDAGVTPVEIPAPAVRDHDFHEQICEGERAAFAGSIRALLVFTVVGTVMVFTGVVALVWVLTHLN